VFILTDDQGAWAMGCAGNQEIITPNLDRIAAEGMRFTNFFCASPVCSPARASLLTGRIPSQHGIHDWLKGGNEGPDALEFLAGQRAYTDVLAEHGYRCGISGKWHMGDSVTPQKSFADWCVHRRGGSQYYNSPMVRDGVEYTETGYLTDHITDVALEYLEQYAQGESPFYLSVHYTAPHFPYLNNNHPQAYRDLYKDCAFDSCPQEPTHPDIWAKSVPEVARDLRGCLVGYFAAVTAMDANVGRIVNRLDELKLRENTLLIFTGDNGFSCGKHGFWGKGNGTFPQNMFDITVKVPFIASQPGRIPAGTICEELVSAYDFMPTLLDYAGLPYEPAEPLPGTSFAPLLADGEMKSDKVVVVHDEYGPVRMIRSREWKYIHRYPYGPHELYHLTVDPDERINLINEPSCQSAVKEMKAGLEAWFVRYVDPDLDGTHEPVTGRGQLLLAGPAGAGAKAFESFEET
jgi:arylsulfatase A-like enzyme